MDALSRDQRNLKTSAPKIHGEPLLIAELNATADGGPDQAGLFGAGDGLELDAALSADSLDQFAPVARLPDGAGCHGPIAGNSQRVDGPAEGRHPFDGGLHGALVEAASDEGLVAQTDGQALDFEVDPVAGVDELGSGKANRVGADIDGRNAQGKGRG